MKLKKLNTCGFSHDIVFVLFILIFAIAGIGYLIASHASTPMPTFIYLATDQPASVQPTAWGKTIEALVPWNNKIYAGYGDYNANTGPLAINPFNPATNTFDPPENQPCGATVYPATGTGCDQTEEIFTYRIINNKLYAPSIDPRGAVSTDYAVGSLANGTVNWQQVGPSNSLRGIGFEHAFDMATLTGSDLWEVGSKAEFAAGSTTVVNGDAVAYRSLDGGNTWQKMLDLPPSTAGGENRFYWAAAYNNKLYVEPTNYAYSEVFDPSKVTNGDPSTGWSQGTQFHNGVHPSVFNGEIVYLSGGDAEPLATQMLYFNDGTKLNYGVSGATFYDYAIDRSTNTLYGLSSTGAVYSTQNLASWYQQAVAPPGARSITVYNSIVYVGTTDSKIYSAPVANPGTAITTVFGVSPSATTCQRKHC